MLPFSEAFSSRTDSETLSHSVLIETLQLADIESYINTVLVRIPSFDPYEDASIVAGLTGGYVRKLQLPEQWTILVAKSGGRIVAGLEGEIVDNRESGIVNWIHVDQRFQRGKIATRLYAAYEEVLKKSEISQMTAYIDFQNLPSQAFHRALGFESFRRGKEGSMYRKSLRR